MKEKLEAFKSQIEEMRKKFVSLKDDADYIRSYYKHQNDETRSTSESFIVHYSGYFEFESLIENLDELISYEEDLEEEE